MCYIPNANVLWKQVLDLEIGLGWFSHAKTISSFYSEEIKAELNFTPEEREILGKALSIVRAKRDLVKDKKP